MSEPKRELTKEKMLVYELIFNIAMRFLLVIAGIVGFFIVLIFLVQAKDDTSKYVFGGLELALCGTTYMLYRHFFPSPVKPKTRN